MNLEAFTAGFLSSLALWTSVLLIGAAFRYAVRLMK